MIRFVLAAVLVSTLGLVAPAAAQDDLPDQCRTIVGCADAGPEPEHSGDRGGWAQLLTLGVMATAVAFILTKVVRAARAAQPSSPT